MELSLKIERLSHSFPPDYSNNNKYLARVHNLFAAMELPFNEERVYYRPIFSEIELEEVKLLHKEWFPPEYPDDFYQALLRNNVYKSILCLYDTTIKGQRHTLILGCITYEYRALDYNITKFNLSDIFSEKQGVYILTFGVINEVRKKGMGTKLLRRLIADSAQDNSVKYVYLDVVSYNDQGIRCYENNGFVRIYTKEQHYNIFEKHYDAIVFAYFTNGGERAKTYKEIFRSCLYYANFPYHFYNLCRNVCLRMSRSYSRPAKYKEIKTHSPT